MPNMTYFTGTVSVAAGGTVVTGGGGLIWSPANVVQFDEISIDGLPEVKILEVTDLTHLVIPAWQGGDLTDVPYVIYQSSRLRNDGGPVIAQVDRLVAALNKPGFYHFVGPDEDEPDPSLGEDGQYARKPTTGQEWLKLEGDWVYQGVFGNFTFSEVPWAADTTYAVRVVLPHAGRLWFSLQGANLNHRPDISPAWWSEFLSGGDAYDLCTFDSDRPASGEIVFKFVVTKPVCLLSGLVDSRAHAERGATLQAVFSYRLNGTEFATLTFAAGGQAGPQAGVFASPADVNAVPGDRIYIHAPSLRDETLSGVAATLAGYRNQI